MCSIGCSSAWDRILDVVSQKVEKLRTVWDDLAGIVAPESWGLARRGGLSLIGGWSDGPDGSPASYCWPVTDMASDMQRLTVS